MFGLPPWFSHGVHKVTDPREAAVEHGRRRSMTFFEEGICCSYEEDPLQNMNIEALVVLDGEVTREHVKLLLHERLLRFERFRSKVVRTERGRFCFEELHVGDEVLDSILFEKDLEHGTWEELHEYQRVLLFMPWREGLPRWDVHILRKFTEEGEGMAILFRFDHSLGDGFSISKVLLSLTDHSSERQEELLQTKRRTKTREELDNKGGGGGMLTMLVRSTVGLLASQLRRVLYFARGLWIAVVEMELNDSRSILSVRNTNPREKEMRISRVYSLDAIKSIARKEEGATVNDVLMAIISGALRRFLELNRDPLLLQPSSFMSTKLVRAIMAASLRGTEHHVKSVFANDITFLPVNIPVTETDFRGRLNKMRKYIDFFKASPTPLMIYVLQQVLVYVFGQKVLQWKIARTQRKQSLVISNLPGPREKVLFARQVVRRLGFWVNPARMSLMISILSYGKDFSIMTTTDPQVIDAGQFMSSIEDEIASVMRQYE